MITLLSKIFVNGKENERQAYGTLCSVVGIMLNVMLFAGKYFAGLISHSIAITADAFNNLSDAGSSFITLVGFRFAGKKPDTEHPFGHGRFEYISGFIVSIAILMMGFELGKSSVSKIIHPVAVETGKLSIIILFISVCIKLYMALYNTRIGKKIDSTAMKATAMDSLSDMVATSVVLLSMLIMKFTSLSIDGISGLLVALFILYAGYNAAKDTLGPLLGQPPKKEFVHEIEDIVLSYEDVVGIHDLVVHDYGPGRCMISLHAEVPGDGDIYKLHDTIDMIERELNEKLCCESVIHMDPIEVNNVVVQDMKLKIKEIVKTIDESITIHDFRMVKGDTHTNLIFDAVVPYKVKISDDDVRKQISDKVQKIDEKLYCVITIDKSYIK